MRYTSNASRGNVTPAVSSWSPWDGLRWPMWKTGNIELSSGGCNWYATEQFFFVMQKGPWYFLLSLMQMRQYIELYRYGCSLSHTQSPSWNSNCHLFKSAYFFMRPWAVCRFIHKPLMSSLHLVCFKSTDSTLESPRPITNELRWWLSV